MTTKIEEAVAREYAKLMLFELLELSGLIPGEEMIKSVVDGTWEDVLPDIKMMFAAIAAYEKAKEMGE